jgi:hypothetical protein
MAVRHGYGKIAGTDALVFAYDTGDTRNSYKGEPTINYIPSSFGYGLYAYASGPVDTTTLNEKGKSITAKRYTITNAVNTARAAIRPSGLTTGVAYTFSFKWKYNGTTTTSPSIGVSAAKGNPEGGSNNNSFTSQTGDTVSIGNGWYLTTYIFVFSSNPTGASILTFGISTGSNTSYLGETFDIYEAQFEVKDHRTPFVNGTRSSTQGLLDLTGNSTIDLTNAAFDSSAQLTFDGTNTAVPITGLTISAQQNKSYEAVIRLPTGYAQTGNIIGGRGNSTNVFLVDSERKLRGGEDDQFIIGSTEMQTGIWYHVAYTFEFDGATTSIQKLYINGVLDNQTTQTNYIDVYVESTQYLGYDWRFAYYFNGDIAVCKVYNKTLTAAEVANNYNHYKGRFNI